MVNFDLKNIEGTLRKNSKTIGKLYGYLAPLAQTDPTDPLRSILQEHTQALNAVMQGKFPNPTNVITEMARGRNRPILKNLLIAYLAGELGGGFIGAGNAKALKDAAMEGFKWNIVGNAVLVWDWNPHAPANMGGGGSSGNSPSWGYKA